MRNCWSTLRRGNVFIDFKTVFVT